MRGNAWQVTAIMAIILVVMLLVPLVIMGRGWQNMADQIKQSKEALQSKEAMDKALQEVQTLREREKQSKVAMDKVLQEVQTLRDRIKTLEQLPPVLQPANIEIIRKKIKPAHEVWSDYEKLKKEF